MRIISVIIPVYNKASLTRQCLDFLMTETHPTFEVELLVIDDASTDITAEILRGYSDHLTTIRHESNSGFARSCNDGAKAAGGEYLVFLNNDILPSAGWLEALVRYADSHPKAAVIGSKLLYPDGTIQHAGVAICQERYPIHLYSGFPADHPAVNKSRPFAIVTAACALFRPGPYHAAGGFDTAYQNGMEDVDLCLRLGQTGHEIHYCAESVLTHLESVTRDIEHEEGQNNKIFFRRWWSRIQPDDFRYYLEDGLMRVGYHRPLYPLPLSVSPLLATLDEEGRQREVDALLNRRAGQVASLLKDNVRLSVSLQETQLQAQRHKQGNSAIQQEDKNDLLPEPRLLIRGEIRWLTQESSQRLVSIIMPVKNAAEKLRRLLPVLFAQQTRDRLELIAVDSSSTDDTVEVMKQAGATVVSIDPRSYNHGLTRNLGAEHARGDVFVFLNQGALPTNERWLANLLAPLDACAEVAGVCSRTRPYEDADLLTRRDVERDEDSSPERKVREIPDRQAYDKLAPDPLRLLINFHTISAAVRPEVFRRIPFRKVMIGEDVLWAKEVLEAGFKVQHEPTSTVFHSHNYSFIELFQRHFDDGLANRNIVGRQFEDSALLPTIFALVREDWKYLRGLTELKPEERDDWLIRAVIRRFSQTVGEWIGVNVDRFPADIIPLLSLTERIKAGTPTESRQSAEFVRPGT